MRVMLLDLPDIIAESGVHVVTYPNWQTRARRAGGFIDVRGVCAHHTASNTHPDNDMGWMWTNSPDRPIGNIFLDRTGKVTVGAAGASNTQGRGGPVQTSKGEVPLDQGNDYLIAIEAANDGTGEVWPDVQVDAYLAMIAALVDGYGLEPGDVFTHAGWTPGRKVDPAGPTPSHPTLGGLTGRTTWPQSALRALIAERLTDPNPDTEDDMTAILYRHPHYHNVWLIGPGGAVHLSPEMAKHYRKLGLHEVTEAHPQALKSALYTSGTSYSDLVGA